MPDENRSLKNQPAWLAIFTKPEPLSRASIAEAIGEIANAQAFSAELGFRV